MTDACFKLTAEQQLLLPSEADVLRYEAEGFYISQPGVIPDEILAQAVRGSERFYRGERDANLSIATGYSNSTGFDEVSPRNNEFVSLQVREFQPLVTSPLIGAIAARLSRSRTIRLLDDQLIWKPSRPEQPQETITGWHADRAYWATCSSEKLLTAWVPLHEIDRQRSPLLVIRGSHRWSGLEHLRQFNLKNLDELIQRFRGEGKPVEIVPMTLQRGQVSFHHGWTVHAGDANTSGKPRLSVAIHLQDGDNHYRPYHAPDGREIHMIDEQLCRKLPNGDPDFSDPSIFPVLWTEER